MHTLQEFLDYMASRFGAAEAYTWIDNGTMVSKSFIDLRNEALWMSRELLNRFGSETKIALIGDMSYSWICAYYGIITGGNVRK